MIWEENLGKTQRSAQWEEGGRVRELEGGVSGEPSWESHHLKSFEETVRSLSLGHHSTRKFTATGAFSHLRVSEDAATNGRWESHWRALGFQCQ